MIQITLLDEDALAILQPFSAYSNDCVEAFNCGVEMSEVFHVAFLSI
jgi:hypothetical protein